jgi:hypothetical protein
LYTAGKLIYFNPFYFKDGTDSKPKYFLVLKVVNNDVVIASLPSSKIHLPQAQPLVHGCLEIPDACINCYIFEANRPITKCGWSFDMNTLLYGNWLDDYNLAILQSNYTIEGVDYEIIGSLTDVELQNVLNCFINSSTVKRKYKRLLGG